MDNHDHNENNNENNNRIAVNRNSLIGLVAGAAAAVGIVYFIKRKKNNTGGDSFVDDISDLVTNATENTKDLVNYTTFNLMETIKQHAGHAGRNPLLNSALTNYYGMIKSGDMIMEGKSAHSAVNKVIKIEGIKHVFSWTSQKYKIKSGNTYVSIVNATFSPAVEIPVYGCANLKVSHFSRLIQGAADEVRRVINAETVDVTNNVRQPQNIPLVDFIESLKTGNGWIVSPTLNDMDLIGRVFDLIVPVKFSPKRGNEQRIKILPIPQFANIMSGFQPWSVDITSGELVDNKLSGSDSAIASYIAEWGPCLKPEECVIVFRNAYVKKGIKHDIYNPLGLTHGNLQEMNVKLKL